MRMKKFITTDFLTDNMEKVHIEKIEEEGGKPGEVDSDFSILLQEEEKILQVMMVNLQHVLYVAPLIIGQEHAQKKLKNTIVIKRHV